MRESSIESKFRDEVKEVGGMAYKFVSPGNAGVPDRVVILQGGKSGFESKVILFGKLYCEFRKRIFFDRKWF